MKKYVFIIYSSGTSQRIYDDFECDADAMLYGRELLEEQKKERDVFVIDVFQAKRFAGSWVCNRWVNSYF